MRWLKAHGRWMALNLSALGVAVTLLLAADPSVGNPASPDASLASGKWAVRFLLLSLSMTPLQRRLGWNHALKLRKPAGLWSFALAGLHVAFTLQESRLSMLRPPLPTYLWLGVTAFLILVLLALTSNRLAMRALKKNWKRLHRLVYLAVGAATCHALLAASTSKKILIQDPEVVTELRLYLAAAAVLLALRLPQLRRLPSLPRFARTRPSSHSTVGIRWIEMQPTARLGAVDSKRSPSSIRTKLPTEAARQQPPLMRNQVWGRRRQDLGGRVFLGDHPRRRDADQELTLDAVAFPVRLRALLPHLAASDARRPPLALPRLHTDRHSTVDHDEGVERFLLINAQGHSWISTQVGGLDRLMPGREYHLVTIKQEPDRSRLRLAVGLGCGQLGGLRTGQENGLGLLGGHRRHARSPPGNSVRYSC